MAMLRSDLIKLVDCIVPFDDVEAQHLQLTVDWLRNARAFFRVLQSDSPSTHLACYSPVIRRQDSSFFLVNHIKSGLWIPPGGHVDYQEHPMNTAIRECNEELGFNPCLLSPKPFFLSINRISSNPDHRDVNFWYLIDYEAEPMRIDAREIAAAKWCKLDKPLPTPRDPSLSRFVSKLLDNKSSLLKPYDLAHTLVPSLN